MTSSLVGSEMCIRDSSLMASRQGEQQALMNCEQMEQPQPETLSPRKESSCLLYTSDAADDM
eukprot:10685260-Prorocentrum_lima.AAC.1